jgi:hypothetical protein
MENNDNIRLLNVNSGEDGTESSDSEEPKYRFNEQEENQQIINLEEDLAACYLDRLAIIL